MSFRNVVMLFNDPVAFKVKSDVPDRVRPCRHGISFKGEDNVDAVFPREAVDLRRKRDQIILGREQFVHGGLISGGRSGIFFQIAEGIDERALVRDNIARFSVMASAGMLDIPDENIKSDAKNDQASGNNTDTNPYLFFEILRFHFLILPHDRHRQNPNARRSGSAAKTPKML